jgi:2,4-dienoyl-CoA reductase-like NADH-dependent reductase (Old Yellow Enzyme family)
MNVNQAILSRFESDILPLKNRAVMSAMTRNFADENHCATDLIKEYYERRAKDGMGLILTEGVIVHHTGDGYNDVPHIETQAQADSWRKVVQTVHAHGTKIFCQLWHVGRISHSDYTGGKPPVSSTNRAATGMNRQNNKPFGEPEALTKSGMEQVQEYFLAATRKALDVGFDGVELHFAHGYLFDQFFDAHVNDRQDEYGGSVENRCRFALELLEKVLREFPANKIAVRLSPSRFMGEVYDWPDLDEMLDYLIGEFDRLGLQILDLSCAKSDYFETSDRVIRKIRPMWKGVLMGGASLTREQANREIEENRLDLVTWGRYSLANPDFVAKLKSDTPWVEYDREMLSTLF